MISFLYFCTKEGDLNFFLYMFVPWCSPDYRYNPEASDQITTTTQSQQVNGFIPGWML